MNHSNIRLQFQKRAQRLVKLDNIATTISTVRIHDEGTSGDV